MTQSSSERIVRRGQEILLGSQWLKLFILVANYSQNIPSLELI